MALRWLSETILYCRADTKKWSAGPVVFGPASKGAEASNLSPPWER
jgi:hypothetical protein